MAGKRRYIAASEFCSSVRDGTHDSPKPVTSGRRLVTSRHLTTGRLDLSQAYLISEADYEAINKRSKVDRWDVLISMIGTVGEPCLIKKEPDFAIKNIGLFKTNSEQDGKWLYYYLRSKEAQQSILAYSRGTTQQYIPLGALRDFPILVTDDPEEQRAIAHVLGTLDDLIELNRETNAILEEMARALFKSWFVDFDPVRRNKDEGGRMKDENSDTSSFTSHPSSFDHLFPDHFQDSELGQIPRGWEVGKFGDVCESSRQGVSPDAINPETPYIGLEHMPRRSIALGEWETAAKVSSGKSAFNKNEILFGKLRPYFHKVGVAPVDGVCSTDILVLVPKLPEWFGLVLGHASSDALVGFADQSSAGTKMPRTNWKDLSSFKIAIPPPDVASAFSRIVRPQVETIQANIFESRDLATLRDTLLPKLLSGEVSVSAAV